MDKLHLLVRQFMLCLQYLASQLYITKFVVTKLFIFVRNENELENKQSTPDLPHPCSNPLWQQGPPLNFMWVSLQHYPKTIHHWFTNTNYHPIFIFIVFTMWMHCVTVLLCHLYCFFVVLALLDIQRKGWIFNKWKKRRNKKLSLIWATELIVLEEERIYLLKSSSEASVM